ncbi:hypothetical protein MMPV_002698 [Pyropia vietnamensis]
MGRGGAQDIESYQESAAPRANKAGSFFGALHTLFAVLTIAAGIGLISTGGWAIANQKDAAYDNLNWKGSVLAINVHLGIVAVVVGVALIIVALLGMLAIGQGCCSIFATVIYVLAMLILVSALSLAAYVLVSIASTGDPGSRTHDVLSDVWKLTVENEPRATCDLEREFRCRGFANNDCVGCSSADVALGTCTSKQSEVCADCTSLPSSGDFSAVGCFDDLLSRLQTVVRPLGITSAVAAAVSGVGLFVFVIARCTV